MTQKETRGWLKGALPADLLQRIAHEMAEHGLEPRIGAGSVEMRLPQGGARLVLGPRGLRAEVRAGDATQLHQIREGVAHLLDHALPGVAPGLVWTGDLGPEGTTPPNMQAATVVTVGRFGASFLRVELACPGAVALAEGGMHFSLLLPPRGRAPVWPRLDAKGRTLWPEGADALHRAAFTFVEIDPDAGRIVFDVFDHAGGPAADWLRAARPGEPVALMGPGGGDFPPGETLLMAGDETALPAIRRILERSAPTRRGRVILEMGRAGDCLPLAAPPGIEVDWVLRGEGASFWQRILAAPLPAPDEGRFVWIAAEQALVRRAKAHFRTTLGVGRAESYFSAYWAA